VLVVAIAASEVAGACGREVAGGSGLKGSILVSGSSTVEPISTRAAELFNDVEPGVEVTIDGPGTGDGFKRFCQGDVDIADASRRIMPEEQARCTDKRIDYVELVVAIDGLAVLTNARTGTLQCLSIADLYALVGPESKGFTSWTDAQALATELGSKTVMPSTRLKITAPGTESGTYDSFVELVIAPIATERVAAGLLDPADEKATRPDYTSASDDNTILANIEGTKGALGWVGFAFAEEGGDQVREVAIDAKGDGHCVAPTAATIADGTYPLARELFVYVNAEHLRREPALVAYLDFYLGDGYQKAVTTALGTIGYVPLPAARLAQTRAAWAGASRGRA
jgi:phosphate transport system substrate-binding protein